MVVVRWTCLSTACAYMSMCSQHTLQTPTQPRRCALSRVGANAASPVRRRCSRRHSCRRLRRCCCLTCFDLLECARLCAALEGRVATQQDVHDHTRRPYVRQAVIVLVEHLGGNIPAAAAVPPPRTQVMKHHTAASDPKEPHTADLLLRLQKCCESRDGWQSCEDVSLTHCELALSTSRQLQLQQCSPACLPLTLLCPLCCAGAGLAHRSLLCQSRSPGKTGRQAGRASTGGQLTCITAHSPLPCPANRIHNIVPHMECTAD